MEPLSSMAGGSRARDESQNFCFIVIASSFAALDHPYAWKGKDEKLTPRIPLRVDRKISSGRTIEMGAWVIGRHQCRHRRIPLWIGNFLA